VTFFSGQALRTWHFARPLLDAGNAVDLVVLQVEGQANRKPDDPPLIPRTRGDFPYSVINAADPAQILAIMQDHVGRNRFDGIVAVNLNAANIACRLATRLPIWADLNGHVMGEAQTKCVVYGSDEYLKHFWERERLALRRADRFSAVSYKQMCAVLGELGAVGRLNRFTATHPFLTVIPNAAYEEFLDPASYPSERCYRGTVFPDDSFAVLWSGAFNTWTDTLSLAASLSLAMEQDSRIRFVVTGGAVPGHDERTYEGFLGEMERTGFLDRCHLLGWVEARELFALYRECDLGINIDALNYETMFGARNRLTNMMAAGLPILTTIGTEITEIVEESRLGYTARIGKVQDFADAILRACRYPTERRTFAQRAKAYCLENFSYEATTRILCQWAEKPALAPDNAAKISRWPDERNPSRVALNTLEEEAMLIEGNSLPELLQQRADLLALREKPLFKLYKKLFPDKTKK
jgi:glycosyltransferase involved in cell wall biosynthesis